MSHFDDLYAFIQVVQAGSFTKACEQLGISKSTLSYSINNLEKRLNIRLLNRTTRNISPTPEGLALYQDIAPHFLAIGTGIEKLHHHQETATGLVRINAGSLPMTMVVYPKLAPLLAEYPQITVELHSDSQFIDIVKENFDIGVRLGDMIANDMVAVKISSPLKMALVATPQYLSGKTIPKTLNDLNAHRLIGMRFALDKAPIAWEFLIDGKIVQYQGKWQTCVNSHAEQAVLHHLGIGWLAYHQMADYIQTGELVELLSDFAMIYPPFYAYFPNRKHHSRAFELVLSALKNEEISHQN